jgi:urease accessory protein
MLARPSHDFSGLVPGTQAADCSPGRQPAPDPGTGRLEVQLVDGASAVVGSRAASPLQLLAPRARGRAAWIVAASHGGGLVVGDAIRLSISVGPGATACLGTQAETKVYRAGAGAPSPGATGTPGLRPAQAERTVKRAFVGARQELAAEVGAGGLLALLPDPVSPFAGSRYAQLQRFELAPGASLAVLDAVTAGRAARGERWAFDGYRARNEVRVGGELVLADALRLEAAEGPPPSTRLLGLELLATVVLVGPRLAGAARALLEELSRAPAAAGADVLEVASPVGDGVLLRLAARSVEAGMTALRARLAFLSEPLDGDPLLRRP